MPFSNASAQDNPREVLLGTFGAGPRSDGRAGEARLDAARQATDMLGDAMAALDRGDVMLGRRRLEAIVSQHPDTLAASTARRELSLLRGEQDAARGYGDWRAPAAGTREVGFTASMAAPTPLRPPPHQPVGAPVAAADARRLEALERDFQVAAGDRVFFADGSADIGTRARAVIEAQARWLSRQPDLPIVIEAHADDHGSREDNAELSRRRAEAVRRRLVEQGIPDERIAIRVYGKDQPVATCPAFECAAQNRRVVTSISPYRGDTGARPSGSAAAERQVPQR